MLREWSVRSRIDFQSLRLFISMIEERSITRAAERHRIANSAVSKRIAYLEESFASSCFVRAKTELRRPLKVSLSLGKHVILSGRSMTSKVRCAIKHQARGGMFSWSPTSNDFW
ncbi:MAG: LysR family transcriptional regulator [Variibacter sp.]